MKNNQVLLSPNEYEKLTEELDYLTNERRREVAERIRHARGFGDLSENAEYDAAKDEQAALEAKIAKKKDMLKRAKVILPEDVDLDRVNVGSKVKIRDLDHDEEFSYTIVGAAYADPARNRISYRSPVGEALYGKTVGEEVDVNLPAGVVTYRIEDIKWVGGTTEDLEEANEG